MRVMTPDEISRAGFLWAQGRNTHDIATVMMLDEATIADHLPAIRTSARLGPMGKI
jgi:hypothetical protein